MAGRPKKPRGPLASAPEGTLPDKPSGLSPVASAEWDMLVAELTATGAISQVDRAAIEMAARYGGYFAEAAEDVQKHGLTVSTKTGAKANPSIRARDDAARIRKTYLEALGLTPASRSRVSATPPDSAPTLEELLSGKADADGWIDRAETEKT